MRQGVADTGMVLLHRVVVVTHRGMRLVFLRMAIARERIGPEHNREDQDRGYQ